MDFLSDISLIVPVVTSAIAALGFLHVFSSLIRNETTLHDLRRRVKELQYGRALEVARRHGTLEPDNGDADEGVEGLDPGDESDVVIVDGDQSDAPAPAGEIGAGDQASGVSAPSRAASAA